MGREKQSQEERCPEVVADDLWVANFAFDSLFACQYLSGLVDVHYVELQIMDGVPVVCFFVTRKDRTGILFEGGDLVGLKIDSFYKDLQSNFVELYQGLPPAS